MNHRTFLLISVSIRRIHCENKKETKKELYDNCPKGAFQCHVKIPLSQLMIPTGRRQTSLLFQGHSWGGGGGSQGFWNPPLTPQSDLTTIRLTDKTAFGDLEPSFPVQNAGYAPVFTKRGEFASGTPPRPNSFQ